MPKNKSFAKDMLTEWKSILLNPNSTLSKFKQHTLLVSTTYTFIAGFITAAIFMLVSYIIGQKTPAIILLTPIFVVFFMYLAAAFLWIFGKLFGTKAKWQDWTAQYFAAWAPIGSLSGIQLIGPIAQLYGLYIGFLSIKNFMKLSNIKSWLILGIYIAVLFAISLAYYPAYPAVQ